MTNFWDELDQVEADIENSSCEFIQTIYLGTSSFGRIIKAYTYTYDRALPYVVIIGCPHGNEPAGAWFCLHFLRRLTRNICLSNFFIIPVLDFEIAYKNKPWMYSEFDYTNFLKNNFINPVYEQIEFSYNLYGKHDDTIVAKLNFYIEKLDIKFILSVHQTPSVYGTYCYTNIQNKVLHKKIIKLFKSYGLPIELLPQGVGVKIYTPGVFAKFSKENLGSYHMSFNPRNSSQEYFSDYLKATYLTIELPFGWPRQSEKYRCDLRELLKKLSLKELSEKQKNAYYWLKAFNFPFKDDITLLFYKAQFLGMLLDTDDSEISEISAELFEHVCEIIKLSSLRWMDYDKYTSLIEEFVLMEGFFG